MFADIQSMHVYAAYAYNSPDIPALVPHVILGGSVSFSFRFPMELNPQADLASLVER